MGLVRTSSRQVRAVAVVAAALTGFGGAAAVDAMAGRDLPIAEADGFGEGDGLIRYVVTAASGEATPELLATLDGTAGVESAQPLPDGTALVAADGLPPAALRSVPGVADVEVSPPVPVLGWVSDPYAAQYGWNLENDGTNVYQQAATADADVDVTDGWAASTGRGIVIALTDTGFDSDHPDLVGSLWNNPDQPCGSTDTDGNGLAGDCHGWNFYTETADIDNGAGGSHGASVAGVLGARANNGVGSAGVAPQVSIMPLVIGGGGHVDANLGAKAIRYAVDHGATIVNASWGGQFAGQPLDNLKSAIAYAASKGVLVVAAAGNDAANRDTSILYPASLPDANIITVGSSNAVDGVSDSSAYGAAMVDLFAPGNKVATTWNDGGMRTVSGTSIAAPHVAAALALYRNEMPSATAAELKTALLEDVDPVPVFAGKSVTGGRLTLRHLAPPPADRVDYLFSSMTSPAGTVTPVVRTTGPDSPGTYAVTVGLGMEHAGEVWALADTPISLSGTSLTTDDAGTVTFPLGALSTARSLTLSPSVELGDGRYALSVQLTKDGRALGRPYAAPLLVGTAVPAPGSPTPGTTPGDPTPGTTGPGNGTTPPGTTTPGSPTPGATDPDSDTTPPGTTPPGTTPPGTPAPGTTEPGSDTTPPGTEDGTPVPGSTTPVPDQDSSPVPTPDGGTDPAPGDGTVPNTPAGSTPPGTTPDGGTTPDTTVPAPGTTQPGTDPDDEPGEETPPVVTYPEVGPFGLTSVSPSVVGTDGGTRVTITGTRVPDQVRVLVGATGSATVVRSDDTSIVFIAPALVAGIYDVSVFSPGVAEPTVLAGGLRYVDDPDVAAPDQNSGTDAPGDDTDGTGGDSALPTEAVGPDGQRLVRSAAFGSLGTSFWSLRCSISCTGVQL
ncbi:S8 family serine peptidase [Modestobacter lacusdianchii]